MITDHLPLPGSANEVGAICLATAACFVLGGVWYGSLFADEWSNALCAELGVKKRDMQATIDKRWPVKMNSCLAISAASALLRAYASFAVMSAFNVGTLVDAAGISLLVFAGTYLTTVHNPLWQGTPMTIIMIDTLNELVAGVLTASVVFFVTGGFAAAPVATPRGANGTTPVTPAEAPPGSALDLIPGKDAMFAIAASTAVNFVLAGMTWYSTFFDDTFNNAVMAFRGKTSYTPKSVEAWRDSRSTPFGCLLASAATCYLVRSWVTWIVLSALGVQSTVWAVGVGIALFLGGLLPSLHHRFWSGRALNGIAIDVGSEFLQVVITSVVLTHF